MKSDEKAWRSDADRQHGAVAHGQLRAAGLSPRQIGLRSRGGVIEPVFRGVYRVAGAPETFEQRLMAACLATKGAASHRAAAFLWGMRGFDRGLVEVTVDGRRQPELPGVIGHTSSRLEAVDLTARLGVPVTTPARTLVDLAAVVRGDHLEPALEDALHRNLVTRSWLERTAERLGGPLRRLLEERDPAAAPTESVLEDEIVRVLRDAGLPEPVRQHRVGDVRIDVAYPHQLLAIEGQSLLWHAGRADLQRDCEKHTFLARHGWRVLLFTWHDVRRRRRIVVDIVAAALAALA